MAYNPFFAFKKNSFHVKGVKNVAKKVKVL